MIQIKSIDQGLLVRQELTSPSVYLDHWALRSISESKALAHRFSQALRSNGGTFALSWLNLVEFSKVSDEAQRIKADLLLDGLTENAFWLNPDFFAVGKQELEGTSESPHSDLEFLRDFVVTSFKGFGNGPILSPQHHFAIVRRLPGIQEKFDNFGDLVISQLQSLRHGFEDSREMQAAVRRPPTAQGLPRGTRLIAHELIGRLLKDKLIKINRNNAIDLSHAVVAVSYCDYVLLDAHWAAMVSEARNRIVKAGTSIPIARVFSKRANGMEQFLDELEGKAGQWWLSIG